MNKRLTLIIILTSALWLFGLSAKAQTIGGSVYGGGNKAAVTGAVSVEISAGEVKQNVFGGGNLAGINNTTGQTDGTATVTIEGGIIGSHTTDPNTYGIYGGCNSEGTVAERVQVNIKGGTLGRTGDNSYRLKGVYGGGLGQNTNTSGNVEVIIGENSNPTIYGDVYGGSALGKVNGTSVSTTLHTTVTMKNGAVYGDIYGGGLGQLTGTGGAIQAMVYSPVTVTVEGGSVSTYTAGTETKGGNVFGCNNLNGAPQSTVQVDVTGGTVRANVYGGGNLATYGTAGSNYPVVNVSGGSVANVFGGGMGSSDPTKGVVTGNPQVTVSNNGAVSSNVYGGGQLATTIGNPSVSVTGGGAAMVFGGGMQAGIQGGPTVSISGGTVSTGVYGGCNESGTVDNKATVSITGGTIGNSGNTSGVVYGGGLGEATKVKGDVAVTISNAAATVNGDVYGGSAKGLVNCNDAGTGATTGSKTDVTLSAGTINGNLYGGGHGLDNQEAHVYGPVTVAINGGSVKNVFGGNNLKGTPQNTIQVGVGGGTINNNVYGGGNEAAYSYSGNYPAVSIVDGTVTGSVFGGGKGSGAAVTGNPTVVVGDNNESHSAKVTANVYGGGDEAAVTGNTSVTYNDNGATSTVSNIFGGGNKATVSGNTHVTFSNGTVTDVYGGGAFAHVGTVASGGENPTAATTHVVDILGGQVDGNVYGGGLGGVQGSTTYEPRVNGVVTVNIGSGTVNPTTGVVTGLSGSVTFGANSSVYGCNDAKGSPQDDVYVNIFQTKHTDDNHYQTGTEYAIKQVFGGGRKASYAPEDNDPDSEKKAHVNVYTCANTIEDLFGGGDAADAVGVSTLVKGGRFSRIFGGGNGAGNHTNPQDPNYNPGANIGAGGVTLTINGGQIGSFFGGSNEYGSINGPLNVNVQDDGICGLNIMDFFCGSNMVDINGDVNTTIACGSGTAGMNITNLYGGSNLANITGNVSLTVKGGTYTNVFGGSKGDAERLNVGNVTSHTNHPANIGGNVTLNLMGGTIENAFGGSDVLGNIGGKIYVNVLDDGNSDGCSLELHNVYGGGRDAFYTPNVVDNYPEVNIIHGTVLKKADGTGGNVFGGGYGETAVVKSNPKVRVGYDNTMSSCIPSGYGVAVDDRHAVVEGNVYGGGDLAAVAGVTSVTIQKTNSSVTNLFGGGNQASVGKANVSVTGGAVSTGVYGGCNVSGYVGGSIDSYSLTTTSTGTTINTNQNSFDGDITVDITSNLGNGTSGTTPLAEGIYGGGKGEGTHTTGNVTVTIDKAETQGATAPVIYSDIYGGSALGQVGGNGKLTKVDFKDGELHGIIYGGGMGCVVDNTHTEAHAAEVTGNVEVAVSGGSISGSAIAGTNTKGGVFGGCNVNGVVKGGSTVGITNGSVAANVYGGGLGETTTVEGAVEVTVGASSTITGDIYGGSAQGLVNYTYNSSSSTYSINQGNNIFTKVNMEGGAVSGNVYGGGHGLANKEANVGRAVTVTVNSGSVNNVFGCNNVYGAPKSDVTVDINNNVTGNVYGGGNLAACGVSPVVYINNGTVGGNVFGGGLGSTAVVAGAPTVTVGDLTSGHEAYVATVSGDVYGGGDAANVSGTTSVLVQKCNTIVNGDVYGGGNAADIVKNNGVGGSTSVIVTGGTINATNDNHGNVFGGGHGNKNASPAVAANVEGNTSVEINGGTIKRVFGGSNSMGNIGGSTSVTVEKDSDACAMHIAEVYGGGNEAEGNAGSINIVCTGGTDEGVGDVYGGAKAAKVNGDIELNITGGTINRVFGGNNLSGFIDGDITVNVEWGSGCDNNSLNYVYGGGNQAAYTQKTAGHPQVNIKNGTVSQDVFGGGLGSTASVLGNPVVNIQGGTVSGTTFGGGSLAPVTGNPTVNALYGTAQTIHGGGLGASAIVTGNPKVVVNQTTGKTLTVTNVFGGGDAAGVTGNTTVQLQAGTVTNAFGGGNVADITGTTLVSLEGATATAASIYGGGNMASVSSTTTVNISNGSVTTGVYGGCNTSGTVGGTATVNVTGGTVGTDADHTASIYGGGLGESTRMSGDVAVNIGATSGGDNPTYSGDATIFGDVYGGSAKGKTNCNAEGTAHQGASKTDVALYSGTIHGDLYGGGHGPTNESADVWGPVLVKTKGGSVNNVFGGNNVAGMPKSTVQVDIQGGTISSNVYGGGNLAIYGTTSNNYPVVNITNGTVANVFGGGMGSTDPTKGVVTGNPQVTVNGGTVSNNVYGGGQLAKTIGNPNVSVSSGSAATVFGGGMQAGIQGAPTINIQGGSVSTGVYGGCNVSGTVDNKATVSITGGSIGNSGNTTGVVYGGGLGENTKVKGDVEVSISNASVTINGDVYGGSAKGLVNCNDAGTGATTGSKTDVTLSAGTINGNLYGGGHGLDNQEAHVYGPVTVAINGGSVKNVFGCNNLLGTPQSTVQVNVGGGTIVQDVYGGGNMANTSATPVVSINGGTVTRNVYGGGAFANTGATTVDILGGTITGDIYGGGLGDGTHTPLVNGEVHVNIGKRITEPSVDTIGNAIINGNVYGCNNAAGSPQDNVYVDVWKTYQEGATLYSGTGFAIADVFGGGNQADFTVANKRSNVYIHGCDNTIHRVFGGGNNADAWGVATTIDGGRFEYVFGGGNGEGDGHEANIGLGGASLTIMGGNVGQFFGGSNEHGTITGELTVTATSGECGLDIENFFCGSNQVYIAGDVNTTITCNGSMNVKNLYGGSNLANIGGNVTLTVEGGTYENVFGGSKGDLANNRYADIAKDVTLNLYGGTIDNAFGGSDDLGRIFGKITVNVIDDKSMANNVETCPLVLHNVYGGGRKAFYQPTIVGAYPEVNIIHGEVTKKAVTDPNTNEVTYMGGNVFGGGLGAEAIVTSNPKVTIGYASGYTYPANATQPQTPKAEVRGNVYGGGDLAQVTGSPVVMVQKNNTRLYSDVYGGGNLANVSGSTTVTVNEGIVSYDVYGGGALAHTGGSTVTLAGGQVRDLYGGGLGRAAATGIDPIAAQVNGPVSVTVNGGTVNDVFGCNNVNGAPTQTVQVNINSDVSGNVYGGGNLAGSLSGNNISPIVYINKGTVTNVFGGGNGDPNITTGETAVITGNPEVVIGDSDGSHEIHVTNVYGGGNAAKVAGNTKVTYNDNNTTSTVAKLFGGGNAAGVTGTTEVNMNQGKVINGIYGGCNSKGTVGGAINVYVKGGTLGLNNAPLEGIYGGGYGKDTKTTDDVTVTIGYGGTTPTIYGDVYGGSALGQVGASNKLTKVDFLDGILKGTLYGGGMGQTGNNPVAAEVTGAVQVAVTTGSISGGVYGGCNLNGDVKGNITVGITKGTIGTSTSARANVHGGGLGAATTTKGAVTVNIAANNATEGPTIYGDLYGGSGFGQVSATDKLTQVNFYKGAINGDIYGGGLGSNEHSAEVSGNVEVNIRGGVFNNAAGAAGGGQIFGCNNAKGTPKGNVAVHIYGTDHGADPEHNKYPTGITTAAQLATNATTQTYAIAAVYGGGNLASYEPVADKSTTVHVYNCDNTIKDVFGGGNAANVGTQSVNANTYITIDGGRINRVFGGGNGQTAAANINGLATTTINAGLIDQIFGGGNVNGTISNTSLNLAKSGSCTDEVFREVFGGANLAPIAGEVNTTINCGVGTIGEIYGGSNLARIGTEGTTDATVNLTINGGEYQYVFGGSKGADNNPANIYGHVNLNLHGGTIANAFGGSNVEGNVSGKITVDVLDNEGTCPLNLTNVYGGGKDASYQPNTATLASPEVNIKHIKQNHSITNVYGGGYGSSAEVKAYPKVTIGDTESTHYATISNNVYGGGEQAPVTGSPTVIIQNANSTVKNIFGGGNLANVSAGTIVNINGGTVSQDVYGGGALANTGGSNVTLAGGTVTQDIYGGGLGRAAATGVEPIAAQVTGAVQVTVTSGSVRDVYGCNNVNGSPTNTVTVDIEGPVGNNVYGGGNLATSGITPVVNIMTGANVTGSVFGGGNNASVAGGDVNMQAGTILGGLYGGCNTNGSSGNITVDVTGGTIGASGTPANVHGGGYGNGTSTTGDVEVTINGSSAAIWGDVYGGSAKGHVNDAAADHTNVTLTRGTIHGDLYGGGLGDADNAATVNGAVQVTVNGGTVTGSVYGCNNANGAPQSTVKVDIYGTDTPASGYALANVFGGGNQAAYTNTPVVQVHNCNNSIGYVYGGGNAANVKGTDVTIYGGNSIGYVFGGCYGASVTDDGTDVKIHGGKIGKVFGGNNASGTINGNVTVNVNKETETGHDACPMKVEEVYGGGNLADGKAGTITIGCTGTWTTTGTNNHTNHDNTNNRIGYELEGIGTVYGGANQANVSNGIDLNIENGIIDNVFGGNNTSGNISDTIRVTINKNGGCDWYVGNVFGGGNLAKYAAPANKTNYPKVRILNGTVSGDVFGGGLGQTGDAGKVTGNTQVTVNGANAAVNGSVYGGGSLAPTQGNPVVTLTNGALTKVFGGGKAADVTGAPTVGITGGTVSTGVYGGCDSQGNVSGDITVNVTGGTIGSQASLNNNTTADIFGGGYGENTTTSGNVTVTFGTAPAPSATPTLNESLKIYGDIYGGSALGQVNASSGNNTIVNVLDGQLISKEIPHTTPVNYIEYLGGNVFGGGLGEIGNTTKGQVNGKVFVNIGAASRALDPTNDSTTLGNAAIGGNVYGCNNTSGSPQDDVTVNIYRTYRRSTDQINYTETSSEPATYAIANVFGGGNKANYTATDKTANVNIFSCYNSIRRLFGGGNAAAAPNVHTTIQGGRFEEVFGGGNGEVSAADITGNVNLEIHGGTVGEFYVGSNQNGSISGTSNVTVDQSSGCEEVNITEFYCGGKYADFVGDINATITCSQDMHVTNLYGGCKEAHVKAGNGGSGNIHLTVVGGTFENVYGGSRGTQTKGADIEGNITLDIFGGTITKAIYGGSNVKGAIGGTITVNVEDKYPNDNCSLEVSTADVYGGGNQADYPGVPAPDSPITGTITHTSPYNYPEVNIKNATVKNVFGGGLNATVTGNPQIFIKNKAKVLGNVYGGGNMGEVNGNPKVIVNGKMQ